MNTFDDRRIPDWDDDLLDRWDWDFDSRDLHDYGADTWPATITHTEES